MSFESGLLDLVKVKANPNDSFTLTLSPRAEHTLKRLCDENSITKAKQLEDLLIDLFKNKIHEYKNRDGPLMAEKYEALSDEDKAKIDSILENSNA